MKKVFFAFLAAILCSLQAFATQNALDFMNDIKTLGASSDAGLGHIFYSLDTLNCSEKKSKDCNEPTYMCDAMPDNNNTDNSVTADGELAKSLFTTLKNSTTSKPSCDDSGACTYYATDVQCRQANADNWDPGTAPSEAERTDCHFMIQIQL